MQDEPIARLCAIVADFRASAPATPPVVWHGPAIPADLAIPAAHPDPEVARVYAHLAALIALYRRPGNRACHAVYAAIVDALDHLADPAHPAPEPWYLAGWDIPPRSVTA